MGANSSKIEEFIINKSFPLIDYDVTVRKFDNIYSGDIQVIQNKYNPNDIKLMKEHHHIDYNSLEIELEKLDNLIKINNECPNLLKVFGYSHIKDSIFCGKIQKFYIISEYLDLSLKNEIKTRTLEKKPFTENEIFKLIKDVTFALRHLKQKNIKYDFLKTKSIFIGKNNFKILLPSLFNIIPNYLEFMRISNKEDFEVFLSPEALKNIKEKWISVNFDQFKSDIFVLGCIALEVMGKFTCLDLINVQNMEINLKLLEKAIKTIQKEFTETHWRLIKDMLEENPDKRIGLDEILKRLDHINPIITEEVFFIF